MFEGKVGAAILVLVGMFLGVCAAKQIPSSADNPNLWEQMDDSGKFGYILGFSNASENYQMALRAEQNGCNDETKNRITAFLEQNPMSHAALGKWKSFLDEFYHDPRNKKINLVFAMQIAYLQMAGRPQSEIEGQLQRMRVLSTTP
jgi:hypothetical protein